MSDLASSPAGLDEAAGAATVAGPRRPSAAPPSARARGTVAALGALPALLTLYLSFDSGGFFAGAPGLVATVLGLLLVLRITLADDPFAGLTRQLALAGAALGLFAVWALLSAFWSDAPARAVIEFDRAVMYWLAILLLGSVPWTPARLAWAVRGVALAIAVVGGAAFVSRVLPEVLHTTTLVQNTRLGYPLSYWNALGILTGLGLVLCLHVSSAPREPLVARLLAAGAMPPIAGALFFSFSRGGAVAAVAGAAIYVALARPRALPGALLAAVPALAATLLACYDADLLAGDRPKSAAAVAQGHDVALVVAACVAGAILLRLIGTRLDAALGRVTIGFPRAGAGPALAAGAAALVVVAVAFAALGGGGWLGDQYDRLTASDANEGGDLRSRFSSADNNGRVEQWRVALDAFERKPLAGTGAGTFGQVWARERDGEMKVEDAHSLYLETLAELGVVGLALLAVFLGVLLVGVARRVRGPDRHVYAAILACLVLWALHAGIDWDWEMPAVTAWVLVLGAMALTAAGGARGGAARGGGLGRMTRVTLGVGCLALVALPALTALSQQRLDDSVAAFKRGDCRQAIAAALESADAMSVRPEPFAILGYCDSRLGEHGLAVEMLEAAIDRDPGDWQLHYGLALVRAAGGRDPRPALRTARRLNPNELLVRDAVLGFRTDDPRVWQRRARDAPLPIL